MKRALLLLSALIAAPALAEPLPVDGGMIDGKELAGGVTGWFGVPFAAPPVRELRWRAPQPVVPWQGTFHADRFAPMCLQGMRARTMNHYFGNEAISEDCLYLNVWAPSDAVQTGGKKPVIVWIYGGGFSVGSASMANYAGENMARDGDVVYVSIAYRVGPMGFLAHPELSAENGGHSGNYGLADQVAALEWVQRNIAQFGGDPDNVTIMGQSAGSMAVSLLQLNPRAAGLFDRIVGMSGSAHGREGGAVPLAQGEAQGVAVQQALGAASIEAMRDMPGDRILAGATGVPRSPIVIDGENITGTATQIFAARAQNDVPIMVGFTRDERFANLGPVGNVQEYEAAVRAAFGAQAGEVLRAYPATTDAAVARASVDLMRDMSVGRQMFGWAAANTQSSASPAYAYFFTRRQPYVAGITFADHDPATVGAYHTGEVPYFLRNLDSLNLFRPTREWTPVDFSLSDTMSGMILAFARGQAPAQGWPAFDPAHPQVMVLGEQTVVGAQNGLADWPNWRSLPLLDDAQSAPPVRAANRPRD